MYHVAYTYFCFQTVENCEIPRKSHYMVYCNSWLLALHICRSLCQNDPFHPFVAGQVMYIVPLMWLRTIMEYQYKLHGLSVACATVGREEVDWKRSQDSVELGCLMTFTAQFGET